jgi:hypothetical protein
MENHGKSQFLMGKFTINCHFQSLTVKLPEGRSFRFAKDLGTFDPSSSRRLGILLRQPLKARAAGPPCHISFLSEESNKAKG